MSTEIPNGYGLCVVTMTCLGSVHPSQFTFGFKRDAAQTAAQHGGGLRNFLTQSGKPFQNTNFDASWTWASIKVTIRNTIGQLEIYEDVTPIDGFTAKTPVPMNSALLINKRTGFAGRRYSGRMFVPPCHFIEADVSPAGIILNTALASQQSKWDSVLTSMATALFPMMLFHSDGAIPTEVTSLQLSPKVGTLRRRLRG